MNTEHGACRSTMVGTLSRTRQRAPCAPRFPTTIVSASSWAATSQMRSAGSPRSTRVRVTTPGNRAGIAARYTDGSAARSGSTTARRSDSGAT